MNTPQQQYLNLLDLHHAYIELKMKSVSGINISMKAHRKIIKELSEMIHYFRNSI